MSVLYNTLLEFSLNPYAMFTSGYTDRNEFDSQGMTIQQQRSYRIIRFQYLLCLYSFVEDAVKDYIKSSIVRGITITSQGWLLGAQYQIATGQNVRNNWQVNSSC
jgi:hypothetical protein